MNHTAMFGLGCFWGPDESFSKLPGVKSTTVGYSGGMKLNPTYHDLGDHTETVLVEFDPAIIPYGKLLEHFWDEHDPTLAHKTQYRSVIFTQEKQLAVAKKSLEERQKQLGRPVVTAIETAGKFYPAEEYHQKFLQKNRGAAC